MAESRQVKKQPLRITGSYSYNDDELVINRAIINEQLGQLSEAQVEVLSPLKTIAIDKMLGKIMTIHMANDNGAERKFTGTIVHVERLALRAGFVQLLVKLRPWFWMLKKTTDSRIFQEKTAVQIIEQIFNEHGFSDFRKSLNSSYEQREYCVQYRETDFEFVSRLMQEEGIYYFFDYSDAADKLETLVLCDDVSSHKPIEGGASVEYRARIKNKQQPEDCITDWASAQEIVPGVVSLRDFDFNTPNAEMDVRASNKTKASHSYANYELYDAPGHFYKETTLGTTRAEVRMEAEDAKFDRRRGWAYGFAMELGRTFTLKGHPDKTQNDDYLITSTKHYLQTTEGYGFEKNDRDSGQSVLVFPEDCDKIFMLEFRAQPKSVRYRSPLKTPWPNISGLHTAIVTGKNGEEIWTDKHGRIKVQFHWDREGKRDENTSCWVRVSTPWSGKNWGIVGVPRIGQEVVIQFEEGDPDRPICTGMLYNADTMQPYALPTNQTQSGIKTRSSKGGSAEMFNELMFEDKKGEEVVRFQAQKDYEKLVKNQSTITIGYDKLDVGGNGGDGSLSQVVKNNVDETIKEGDHTFTIETGSQTVSIKTDQTETIEGKSTRTVTGNDAETIKSGNMTTEVSSGNKTTTVKMGNIQVDAKAGKITMTAMQSIELKVGGSSIKLDPTSVTIKSTMITVQANAKLDAKSPLTTVNGDGMLTLKGGVTMIN